MTSDVEIYQHELRHAQDAVREHERGAAATLGKLTAAVETARERLKRAETREQLYDRECPLSERVDGKTHSWRWDGDDPRVVCSYCGEVADALTGRVLIAGRKSEVATS